MFVVTSTDAIEYSGVIIHASGRFNGVKKIIRCLEDINNTLVYFCKASHATLQNWREQLSVFLSHPFIQVANKCERIFVGHCLY